LGPKKERERSKGLLVSSGTYLKNQNQTTTGSSYFKHLKEPPGFMKELAANQWYSEQLYDFLKIDNHGHIQNWVFDF
jgi:hypothetical protein